MGKKNWFCEKKIKFKLMESVGKEYREGFCKCGRSSTEVPWGKNSFCNYCGSEVGMEIRKTRYFMGYFPFSRVIPHFWYYNYEPRPIPNFTGFSHRLFILVIRGEVAVAGQAFFLIKSKKKPFFITQFIKKIEKNKIKIVKKTIKNNVNFIENTFF